MGGARLSKSLIQFSVDGWDCVPILLFDLRPNYGGDNEDNSNLLQKVPSCTASLSAPDPAPGHHRSTPPLDTPGHSRASLGQSLVGSLLLSSGSWYTQSSVCASPVLSSGGSMMGLMVTSSKRAYATPRSAAPRAPGHC